MHKELALLGANHAEMQGVQTPRSNYRLNISLTAILQLV